MTTRFKPAGNLNCPKHGITKHAQFPRPIQGDKLTFDTPVCLKCLAISMQTKTPPIKKIMTR